MSSQILDSERLKVTAEVNEAFRCTEGELAQPLSLLLLVGLLLATTLMLVGVVLAAAGTGSPIPHASSISGLPQAVVSLEPGGFFDLGLLVLLATPVARVVMLSISFARRRAWAFFGMDLAILVILVLSVVLGLSQ